MRAIRHPNIHERARSAVLAASFFGAGMAVVAAVILSERRAEISATRLIGVAALCSAGAIVFGAVMSLLHPLMAPPVEPDEEEELGVPARLIPPSPVLAAAEADEKRV